MINSRNFEGRQYSGMKVESGKGTGVRQAQNIIGIYHQIVQKLNANDYTTSMAGLKYKLSHKTV